MRPRFIPGISLPPFFQVFPRVCYKSGGFFLSKLTSSLTLGKHTQQNLTPEHMAIKKPIKPIKPNEGVITGIIAKHQSALTVMKVSKRDLFRRQLSLFLTLPFFQVTVNFKDAALSPGYAGMREGKRPAAAGSVGFFGPPPDVVSVYELRLR